MSKSYHFDLGDSTNGPIGMCAVVRANSSEAAVEILRDAIGDCLDVDARDDNGDHVVGVEYIEVYFNPQKIDTGDIDSIEEEEDGQKNT